MKSWIALVLALAAGGGIGWFVGYGMGHKSGRKIGSLETADRINFEQGESIDDGMFGGNQASRAR